MCHWLFTDFIFALPRWVLLCNLPKVYWMSRHCNSGIPVNTCTPKLLLNDKIFLLVTLQIPELVLQLAFLVPNSKTFRHEGKKVYVTVLLLKIMEFLLFCFYMLFMIWLGCNSRNLFALGDFALGWHAVPVFNQESKWVNVQASEG